MTPHLPVQPLPDLARRHALGEATADQITQLCRDLLNHGHYSPSVAEIALDPSPYPTLAHVGPLFNEAITELGHPVPTIEAALQWAIEQSVIQIAAPDPTPPTTAPPNTAEPLNKLFLYLLRYPRNTAEDLGTELRLAELAAVAFDLQHTHGPGRAKLLAEARALASQWLRTR